MRKHPIIRLAVISISVFCTMIAPLHAETLSSKLRPLLEKDDQMRSEHPDEYRKDISLRLMSITVYMHLANKHYGNPESERLDCDSEDAKLVEELLNNAREIINDENKFVTENPIFEASPASRAKLLQDTVDSIMPLYLKLTKNILVRNKCFESAENTYEEAIFQLRGSAYESYRQLALNGLADIREKKR